MSANSTSSSSNKSQSPFAPLNALHGSFANVNTPLSKLGESINNAVTIITNFTSQINNNETDYLNDREFLLVNLGISQIEEKFRQLRQEFANAVNSISSNVTSAREARSSATLDATKDEAIVWVGTLHGYAKCRLCQTDCPELTRTDMLLPNNRDASVLCPACFQRLVPSLMSIDC